MATTPTIVVGRNNWGIKNENLLGYYQSDDGFFVKREFAATRGGGTNGTFVGSNGLIQTAASGNLPRIDFYGGSPALLVEPSAQNVARFVNQMTAQDFPAASGGLTSTSGSTDFLAPDGASGSITKYVGGAASGTTQYAYYNGGPITASAAGVHTFSLFVKAGATNPLNFCALQFEAYAGASGTTTSYFSLASGTALTTGASIQNYGNGWYRIISAPYTIAAGDLVGQLTFAFASSSNSLSFAASGALNLTAYTWGAQMEASSVATSYIPTTTGSVTRNADAISLTGATDYIGQTEGTLYAEVDMRVIPQFIVPISIDVGTVNEYLILAANSDGAFRVVIKKSTGSQTQLIISSSNPVGVYKLALAYKNGDYALSINGATPLTSSDSTNYPTGTFSRVHLSLQAYGVGLCRTLSAAIYNKRLPNDQLQALTTL
jgi:hypothetical protein